MNNFQEIATYTSSLINTKSVDILLNIKSSIVQSIEKLKIDLTIFVEVPHLENTVMPSMDQGSTSTPT